MFCPESRTDVWIHFLSLKDEKLNEMNEIDKEKEISKRAEAVGKAIYSRSQM